MDNISGETSQYQSPVINNIKIRIVVHISAIPKLKNNIARLEQTTSNVNNIDIVTTTSASTSTIKTKSKPKPLKKIKLKRERKSQTEKKCFKRHHNFVVYRQNYVFIIFFQKGTVNITGIRSSLKIFDAIDTFCQQFDISKELLSEPIIDNITASGDFRKYVDLSSLKRLINNPKKAVSIISSASFNTGIFPACFCKTFKIGTIIVLASGKYNIVGAKCFNHITQLYMAMSIYISMLK